ncbi:ATP-binding protein [Rhodopirellula sallentina]|uniref:ATP-binding protein n=1 Tax=Rhodopirellula sallentina TaxID=1263869 RepID=UPI00034A0E67|nr:ATP-binding protein [Rhodopirellula sallentina]
MKPLLSSSIELDIYSDDDESTVFVDENLVSQALMNLCINARDAMNDSGKLSIRLASKTVEIDELQSCRDVCELQPGNYVVISVEDEGCGMSDDVADRVFEPFYSTKEVGHGTGLGLSMVFGAAEEHGGCVRVKSKLGEGSTFELYLPVASNEVESDEGVDEVEDAPITGGDETVLVAEDDASVRDITIRSLESAGYNVVAAVDGQDAITKIDQNLNAIQFALIDVVMPYKNGREVAEHLAKVRPDMQVLFCSGYDVQSNTSTWEKTSPKLQVLSKPIDPSSLLRTIREMLDSNTGQLIA